MELKFNENLALNYKSSSQKVRVMSEHWVKKNAYCLLCGANLHSHRNNNPAGDLYCASCKEDYELKSKQGTQGKVRKIVDGAYSTMIDKIKQDKVPNFFFLTYTKNYDISSLIIIPKHYFTEIIIEKRKPLAKTARRAGWIGCNINLNPIPQSGRIHLVHNSVMQDKDKVIESYKKTFFLREYQDSAQKIWTLDVMECLELLNKTEFELHDVYTFEGKLQAKHPKNNNIRPKIRQQLQILRDKNFIEFLGKGKYRLK